MPDPEEKAGRSRAFAVGFSHGSSFRSFLQLLSNKFHRQAASGHAVRSSAAPGEILNSTSRVFRQTGPATQLRGVATCRSRASARCADLALFDISPCSTHRPRNKLRGVATCRSRASARAAPDRWRPSRLPATLFSCALVVWATGCAQLPVETEPVDFRVEGKVSVVEGDAAGKNGKRNFTARFIWRQTADRYDIVLWGPFGQGGARLRGDSRRIEITGGGAGPTLSGEPRTVMRQRLGWSLPLEVLPWWISGRPAPGGPVEASEFDDEGLLRAFRQLGWQVRYDRFDARGEPPRPARITVARPGYRVRVTISSR